MPPNTKKEVNPKNKKWLRWIARILVGMVILIIVLQLVALIFIRPYLEDRLITVIEESSDGIYTLEFDRIGINLFLNRITVYNPHLIPHIEVYEELMITDDVNPNLLEIQAREIQITGFGVLRLYLHDELFLRRLNILDPVIQLTHFAQVESRDPIEIEKLYERLEEYLDRINVRRLIIQSGVADVYLRKNGNIQHIFYSDNFDFQVRNFYLDREVIMEEEHFLYSEDIRLRASDFSYAFANSPHLIDGGEVYISSRDELLEISGLILFRTESGHNIRQVEKPETFQAKADHLNLKGINFNQYYFERTLELENFEVSVPEGNFFISRPVIEEGRETENLYAAISPYLKTFQTDRFLIENARIAIFREHDSVKVFEANEIDFLVQNLLLDSMLYAETGHYFHARDLELRADEYYMRMQDDTHELTARNVLISSIDSIISASNLRLNPVAGISIPLYNREMDWEIEHVTLSGTNFLDAWYEKNLYINRILVQSPGIDHRTAGDAGTRGVQFEPDEIYQLFYPSFHSVAIREIRVNDGSLNLDRRGPGPFQLQTANFNLVVSDFYVDRHTQMSRDRFLFADDISLQFYQSRFYLPEDNYSVRIASGELITSFGTVTIENINFSPHQSREFALRRGNDFFNGQARGLYVRGADFYRAFIQNEFFARQMILLHPDMEIVIHPDFNGEGVGSVRREVYNTVSQYADAVIIQDLQIVSGEIDLHLPYHGRRNEVIVDNLTLQLHNFRIDEGTPDRAAILFSDDAELNLQVIHSSLYLPGTVYEITTGNFTVSTFDDFISVGNIHLSPIVFEEDLPAEFSRILAEIPDPPSLIADIEFPLLTINNIQLKSLLHTGNFHAGSILVRQPQIRMVSLPSLIPDDEEQSPAEIDPEDQIARLAGNLFQVIDIAVMQIEDGQFQYTTEIWDTIQTFEIPSFSFLAENIFIDQEAEMKPGRFMYADNVELVLHDLYHEFPDGIYSASMNTLRVSSGEGVVFIDSFVLKPLDHAFDHGFMAAENRHTLLEIQLPSFEVSGIDFYKLYSRREFVAQNLSLSEAGVIVNRFPELIPHYIEEPEPVENDRQALGNDSIHIDFYPLIADFLNHLSINSMHVANADFNIVQHYEDTLSKFSLEQVEILVREFIIDSASHLHDNRMFHAEDILFRLENFEYFLPDSLNRLQTGNIEISSFTRTVSVDSFRIIPLFAKEELIHHIDEETDWLNLLIDNITFGNVDFINMIFHQRFEASTLNLHNMIAHSYRDKNLPFPDQHRKLPQEFLREMPVLLKIDTILTENLFVRYEELAEGANEPGVVEFHRVNALITDVSNYPELLKENIVAELDATGYFMGDVFLQVKMYYFIAHPDNIFIVNGFLDSTSLRVVNPMLEKVAGLHIDRGVARGIYFSFIANEDYSFGNMRMQYEDLKVRIIDRDEQEISQTTIDRIASFMVNTFLIRSENLLYGGLRTGEIYAPREKDRSLFNYWWKSVFSGIVSSVGHSPLPQLLARSRSEKDSKATQEHERERRNERKNRRRR